MLHYCAGLQHCLDIEEANAAAVATDNENEQVTVGVADEIVEEGIVSPPPEEERTEVNGKVLANEFDNNNVSD